MIDDSTDTTGRTLAVTDTQTTGFNANGLITYSGMGQFTVDGGSGGNTFNIANTVGGITSTFNTGTGSDTTNLQAAAINSVVDIVGQNGQDNVNIGVGGLTLGLVGSSINVTNIAGLTNLTVDDSNDAAARNATISQTSLTGLTAAGPINYNTADLNNLTVKAGNGGNAITISNSGVGSTFPINVTTGTGNDRVIFTDQANLGSGGLVDGGPGVDTLDFSAYTTSITANLSANPQTVTANGTIHARNIENVIGGSGVNTITAPVGVDSTLTGGSENDRFIIPYNAGNVIVNGGGGTDSLEFQADPTTTADTFTQTNNGGQIRTVVTNSTPNHTVTASGINSVLLDGGAGSTTATVDFSGGNPIPAGGDTYTGGGGASNVLILKNNLPGGGFTDEVYNATGPGAGNINLDNGGPESTITFSGLSPVIDSTAVQNYTFNAPPTGVNNIAVTSDATVNGFVGTLIANGDTNLPGFESAAIANKTNVAINTSVATNTTVTVNDPTPGAGLASLTINTGSASDFVNLLATPTGIPLSVFGGNGSDRFNVNAASLGGPTTIDGEAGLNSLIFDAGNATTFQTPTTLQAGTGPILTFANITDISIINIADQPVAPVNPVTGNTVQEGQTFTGVVGNFATIASGVPQVFPKERAADFIATIDWGDGTADTIGTVVTNGATFSPIFSVIGSHTYAAAGVYSLSIALVHDTATTTNTINGVTTTLETNGGAARSFNSGVTVFDAPLTASSIAINTVEGLNYPLTVATFIDNNPLATASDYFVNISWGDGSSTGGADVTITPNGGSSALGRSFTVSAVHRYRGEGNYLVQTTISDTTGAPNSATTTSPAQVSDAHLLATIIPVTGQEGVTLINVPVTTFIDQGGANVENFYVTTIDWGDGTPAIRGLISLGGRRHDVHRPRLAQLQGVGRLFDPRAHPG